jgi:hypothetical protein
VQFDAEKQDKITRGACACNDDKVIFENPLIVVPLVATGAFVGINPTDGLATHLVGSVCSSATLALMDVLPSPASAEAQPGGNNDRRQINNVDRHCKWNSSDCLRLEFWIEIGRIGVQNRGAPRDSQRDRHQEVFRFDVLAWCHQKLHDVP